MRYVLLHDVVCRADSTEESYYHPFCLIDYSNATSELVCWEGDNTVSLPDLRTEDSDVVSMYGTWIGQLVANYSIDGLRIDSCTEVDQAFFPPFQAAGMYCSSHYELGLELTEVSRRHPCPGGSL
jgi:hypothetical protein